MATEDAFASTRLPIMPQDAQSAYERLARWAKDRVGEWGPERPGQAGPGPAVAVGYEPCPHARDARRQRLVNEALLGVVALLLDGAGEDTLNRLHAALDRAVLGAAPASPDAPLLGPRNGS